MAAATCDKGSFGVERELVGISLCTLAQHHRHSLLLLLRSSVSLTKAQILRFLWSTFFWYSCLDLSVFWKCPDFQNMPTWRQHGVLSLFPMNTGAIGKHEQRAEALVRITGIFKEGWSRLLCFISHYFHDLFAIVCASFLVRSCVFYAFCKLLLSKIWLSTTFFKVIEETVCGDCYAVISCVLNVPFSLGTTQLFSEICCFLHNI